MSNQGLKHVATEPARLESKRDRRRGAAGRAAALRRAPSDSDCSGETASLSADSGERPVRPLPQPTRSSKSRGSRRRGSEWEVLEGLKDGQRFDKRPEVFNGYLHKKRKWPLKGWHKRFFVVDGGILVYARSPADVARGRLHGSVDVGLSVISAKARRRRVDIDADEFIYHLRAKTPETFRTWLSVLKAHRLYRQHLLTFGARESVPKIHAPLEDLPPTDASSRSTSFEKFRPVQNTNTSIPFLRTIVFPVAIAPNPRNTKHLNVFKSNKRTAPKGDIHIGDYMKHRSLCSMNCMARKNVTSEDTSPMMSLYTTDTERQVTSTELDGKSFRLQSSLLCKYSLNSQIKSIPFSSPYRIETSKSPPKPAKTVKSKAESGPMPAFFFFNRKHKNHESLMRKSNKSTNLVKYRNQYDEPKLKRPLSRCMLLGRYTSSRSCRNVADDIRYKQPVKKNFEVQIEIENKESKCLQDAMTLYEYDLITERLLTAVFETIQASNPLLCDDTDVKNYIHYIVKELYDIKVAPADVHPIKILFRCLLEYWLKNTSIDNFREEIMPTKSIDRQSNKHFTRDQMISSYNITSDTKQTQYQEKARVSKIPIYVPNKSYKKSLKQVSKFNDSHDKDRQIQELERMLKNTVYMCETVCSGQNKERDIKITKRLIDNIERISRQNDLDNATENEQCDSNSSSELNKIQDTINHLISDAAIPATVAKEFLSAYLDLLHSSHSMTETSTSPEDSKNNVQPVCEVQTESVQKKVSRSITTRELLEENLKDKSHVDPGQLYLKDVLDKITTIFSKERKRKNDTNEMPVSNARKEKCDASVKCDLSCFEEPYGEARHIPVPVAEPKPELNKIFMYKTSKEINIDLPLRQREAPETGPWLPKYVESDSDSSKLFKTKIVPDNVGLSHLVNADGVPQDPIDLKPYLSSTDDNMDSKDKVVFEPQASSSGATSKAYRKNNESKSSIIVEENREIQENVTGSLNAAEFDDSQCYVLSLKGLIGTFQSKKKSSQTSPSDIPACSHPSNYPDEMAVFQKEPRAIDEKFILLLLENLATLSRNIPSIHKDINAFYAKLKKKHEKAVLNSGKIQGLSLLGKIYNEGGHSKSVEEAATQYDATLDGDSKNVTESMTNTSHVLRKVVSNKATCASLILIKNAEMQTDREDKLIEVKRLAPKKNMECLFYTSSAQTTSYTSQSSDDDIFLKDKAVSNQNWYRKTCTRDCAMNTVVKFTLSRSDSSQKFGIVKPVTYEGSQNVAKRVKRKSTKVRNDSVKEISSLSPSLRVSRHAQTERSVKCVKCNDYKVYQLFVSQRFRPGKCASVSNIMEDRLGSDDLATIYRCSSDPSYCSGLVSPGPVRGPQAGFVSGTPGGRLASWIIESGGPLDTVSRELGQAQLSVQQLQRLLDTLELQQQTHHDTDVSIEGASPNVKKDRRKFGLRKKKSNSKCASVESGPHHMDPSNSHMALSTLTAPPSPGAGASSAPNSAASLPIACAATRPQSLPGAEALNAAPASLTSLTPDHQLREDFTMLGKDLVGSLKGIVATLVCERGRLRAAMEAADAGAPGMVAALRTNLSTALQQNSELRARLSRIHDASDLAEVSSVGAQSDQNHQFKHSLSYSSSCVSASEFFDAEEHDNGEVKPNEIINADETGVIELDGDSSSEAGSLTSEEGSASSDNSDAAMVSAEQTVVAQNGSQWSRRRALPAPRPTPGGPSLWNLLYKNIGKDLSQISMPVTINEPLNMLQRLCEELEYSELLDAAAAEKGAVERMALVAAFAVSAYAASAHRAASKPFNPLLAETYECVRQDKRFRFLAEQVSHHPPISACHAESSRWVFWQEARIKTKFWGKSMEFQPAGRVHLTLLTTGDHYVWNKVTTCVHNLFGGQRWVDQYGDMHIACQGSDISCKLHFVKASSWSSARHEVRGAVSAGRGAGLRLHGRWSEALYAGEPPAARCLWRPGTMPPDYEIYYGFTRFAMELNEMEPGMRVLLPHTDTRFRPDQRALEEGDVDAAEQYKLQLEQAQRERRRLASEHVPAWFRKCDSSGEEAWVYGGEYWTARDAGYPQLTAPRLW